MKQCDIRRLEFIGGPEDGRIVELSAAVALNIPAPSEAAVPLLLHGDLSDVREGDEIELTLLGQYVPASRKGDCVKYEWVPL